MSADVGKKILLDKGELNPYENFVFSKKYNTVAYGIVVLQLCYTVRAFNIVLSLDILFLASTSPPRRRGRPTRHLGEKCGLTKFITKK